MFKKIGKFIDDNYSSHLFSSGKFFGILGPVIIDQFFMFLIAVLTTAMISSSSQDSVSAVSLVSPLVYLTMTLFTSISNGGAVVVAQYKGGGEESKLRHAAGQTIFSTIIVGFAVAGIVAIGAKPIVDLLFGTVGESICGKAVEYLVGMGISFIPFTLYISGFCILRGMGESKTCLVLTIVINVVHFVLSFIFLNILHLDVMGTALSFTLARVIGGLTAMIAVMRKHGHIRVRFSDIFKIDGGMQKAIFKMGIPFAIEQCFFNGGTLIAQTYMVFLGDIAVAANAIANSLFSLFYAAGTAVSSTALTIIGQSIGAGDIPLAKRYGSRLIWLGNAVNTLSVVIMLPLTPILLLMYSPEANTIPFIYPLMFIGCAFMPFVWANANIMPSVLRAAGDANYTSIVSLVAMWVVRVGLGWLLALPLGLGINGVWVAMGIEWIVKTIAFRIRFKGEKWYANKLVS